MIIIGILIPFIGTILGAACVFLMKKQLSLTTEKIFSAFAAGVMVAASVWSLLIPSMEQSAHLGKFSFVPAASGFLLGVAFLLLLDRTVPHIHQSTGDEEGIQAEGLDETTKLMLAVTLHNIPEGIAVGVVFAGFMDGNASVSINEALALAVGIAIQNFPEGAIISMPLLIRGMSRGKAFFYGVMSGIVEPIAALFTIYLTSIVMPILSYLLSFAAGAMLYVVVEELIPELGKGKHSNVGVIAFSLGFVLMMILDVALG